MSVLPPEATFSERLQACFATYRGRGVSLSPLDAELVEAWAAAGVPFEIVARGLLKAALARHWHARPGEGSLRSLVSAKRHVDAEIHKYLRTTPAAGNEATTMPSTGEFHVVRGRRLGLALRAAARSQPLLARVAETIAGARPPSDFDEAERLEGFALALCARAVPWPERLNLLRRARRIALDGQILGPSAARSARLFHRIRLTREYFCLPSFW